MDLDSCIGFFNGEIRKYATKPEEDAFDNLIVTAQKAIDRNDRSFDNILETMNKKILFILLRQDWFIIDTYQRYTASPSAYYDKNKFIELKRVGDQALAKDDMDQLRMIIFELSSIRIDYDFGEAMFDTANILKG